MSLRRRIAKILAPGLYSADAVREMVKEEVARAKMAMPITANYDPKNEGYRPLMGGGGQRRDIRLVDIDRMIEVAYFMWDHSAMTRGLALMDKAFLFAEEISATSSDDDVAEILAQLWSRNKLSTRVPLWTMWMSLLGSQCWSATVNKFNGAVTLGYVDPQNIAELFTLPQDVETVVQVELKSMYGRSGRKLTAIREDVNFTSKTYGKLMGECFFYSINHPPNDPWGRSDFLTLFDWIDGLERYGYNYLERAEFLLNFIWDVLLKGMNEEQIRDWQRNNRAPDPGSVRAHNENVEWSAVAPDLKAQDFTSGFEMGKSFIMGAARRPDSWFGGGGKAYQTEADQFGQVPVKDLDERQRYCKEILIDICRFAVDQAVIAKRLSEEKAKAGFTVNMPEISKKDFSKLINGVPQFATALMVAENQNWVRSEDAIKAFSLVMAQLGIEVGVEEILEEMGKRKKAEASGVTDDYRD